jgi:hypothetical protein
MFGGRKKKLLAALGVAGAVGVAGGAVAQAVGERDDDVTATGPKAERAKAAALTAVGGGRVQGVEADREDGSAWEVEVVRADGTEVKVTLDEAYRPVGGIEREDDDRGEREDDDRGEREDDDRGDD